MLGEQQGVENDWNANLAFWINAVNHMCHGHMTDNQVRNCKKEVSCKICNLNPQDVAKWLSMHMQVIS